MPVIITYALTAPTAPIVLDDSGFPGEASQLLCDEGAKDQQYFLDLFDTILPEDFVGPLKNNPNSGYEILQAFAAVGARLSQAVHEIGCNLVIVYSGEGTFAETWVTLYRPDASYGAVTVQAGTIVKTSKGGRRFELIEDAVFTGATLEKAAKCRALSSDYAYNVKGQVTTAAGEILLGEIDTIEYALMQPAYGDPTIKVRQEFDAEGGYPNWLASHGASRGLTRRDGESADAFRLRIRILPDTVTPDAINRRVAATLGALGIGYQIIETFDIEYQTVWDAPSPNPGTPTYQAIPPANPLYDSNLFVWDYGRAGSYANRWLDLSDYRAAFIVLIDETTLQDVGFAYDDPGTDPDDFVDSVGRSRGVGAYDAAVDDGSLFFGVYDGSDLLRRSSLRALYDDLQGAKPVGVTVIIDFLHDW